ncbi:MAG: DUF481 domain-containing protein [Thermodesulfobacteriota bacterium]
MNAEKLARIFNTAALTVLVVFFAGTVSAQQEDGKEKSPWQTEAELGYMMTSGNTDTQNFNTKLDVTREADRWRHNLHAEALYSSEEDDDTGEDEATSQKLQLSGQTNYKFSKASSAYLLGLYEDDRFSGYDYQVTVSSGYARQFVDSDRMELSGEIGPGYRYSKLEDDEAADDDKGEAIIRVGGFFSYRIGEASVFSQEIIVAAGSEKTITRSSTAIRSRIAGNLAMKAAYSVKHTSDVPPDTEKTDTETAVTLVYSF